MSGSITSATGTTATGAAADRTRLGGDMNTFLRLLTTQLQNQDPTKPMDADQLTQQLVQFSTVEQQVNTNSTLQQLLALQQSGQLGEAAQLTGRRVTVESERLPLQSGRAEVVLPAAGRATSAHIEVRDAAGTLVRSADVQLGTGTRSWTWDGTNTRGTQLPDGTYRLSVGGRTSDGAASTIASTIAGTVTGASRDNGAVMLRMGGLSVGYDKLRDLNTGS